MAPNRLGPLQPIATSANATVARALTSRLIEYHNAKSECGSHRWRSYCETEMRLALDAAFPANRVLPPEATA
jgi:hypothetical protein